MRIAALFSARIVTGGSGRVSDDQVGKSRRERATDLLCNHEADLAATTRVNPTATCITPFRVGSGGSQVPKLAAARLQRCESCLEEKVGGLYCTVTYTGFLLGQNLFKLFFGVACRRTATCRKWESLEKEECIFAKKPAATTIPSYRQEGCESLNEDG